VGGPRVVALQNAERVPAYGLRRRRRLTATHPYGLLSRIRCPQTDDVHAGVCRGAWREHYGASLKVGNETHHTSLPSQRVLGTIPTCSGRHRPFRGGRSGRRLGQVLLQCRICQTWFEFDARRGFCVVICRTKNGIASSSPM